MAINDPKNILGLTSLMDESGTYGNMRELEAEIIKGSEIGENEDFVQQYKRDMDALTKNFDNIGSTDFINGESDHEDEIMDNYGYGEISEFEKNITRPAETPSVPQHYETPRYPSHSNLSYQEQPSYNSAPQMNYSRYDEQYKNMTLEEQKQRVVNGVLNDLDDKNLSFNIDKEKEADDKMYILEQIDTLRHTLQQDGFDVSNITIVDKNNSMSEIKNVHDILRLKDDRNQCCTMGENLILTGAQAMEFIFDGKKVWMGRTPDLVGWQNTVRVKLRKMRYHTSTFVGDIMREYNISPGMRIFIDLMLSMFLYSKSRKLAQKDNLSSSRGNTDFMYRESMRELGDMEP